MVLDLSIKKAGSQLLGRRDRWDFWLPGGSRERSALSGVCRGSGALWGKHKDCACASCKRQCRDNAVSSVQGKRAYRTFRNSSGIREPHSPAFMCAEGRDRKKGDEEERIGRG